MSALGHKRTFAVHQPMSALPPIATAKADMPQMVMSALHPKADMCAAPADVCYGPIADIGLSACLRGLQTKAAARGRIIVISVNSPGCVTTSIEPPCCLTMMS
jgi:hypothetical protein